LVQGIGLKVIGLSSDEIDLVIVLVIDTKVKLGEKF